MKKKMIFLPFLFVGMAAVVTWIVMLLWNGLVPDIFGLSIISFWQSLGLLVLSKILFGGFGKSKMRCGTHGSHRMWKHKFKHKWRNMSDEDKSRWEAKFAGTPYSGVAMEMVEDSKLNSGIEGVGG